MYKQYTPNLDTNLILVVKKCKQSTAKFLVPKNLVIGFMFKITGF